MVRVILVVGALSLFGCGAAWADPPAAPPPPALDDSRVVLPQEPTLPEATRDAVAASQKPLRRGRRIGRDHAWSAYVPTVPIAEIRSAWTVAATPPNPFLLTSGEAMTPARGGLSLNVTFLSDERQLTDNQNRIWESDGEVRIYSLEYITPAMYLRLCGRRLPFHVSGSLHGYVLGHATFDWLRNWVEENLLSASQSVLDSHDTGGRDLFVQSPTDRETFLGSSPLWKAKIVGKLGLPPLDLCGSCLVSALSVGITPPAFGDNEDSGNDDVAFDATLAYQMHLGKGFRVTGASSVALPGDSRRLKRLGVATEDVIFSSFLNLEYWFSKRWAFAIGASFNSAFIGGTALPMDLDSWYINAGLQFRCSRKSTLYLLFAENPESTITTTQFADFDDSQKEADFTLTFGWKFAF